MDVKTLCLGALTLGEASGYEIKKQFEEGPFSHFHRASFGSIYPALGKLSAEGLVTCLEMAQDGRPHKKVYAITAAGKEALRKTLRKTPASDCVRSENMVMFFLADFMETDHLRQVYEDYLAFYRRNVEHIKTLDDSGISPHRRFTRGFGLAFYEAAVAYLEDSRDLLLNRDKTETDR